MASGDDMPQATAPPEPLQGVDMITKRKPLVIALIFMLAAAAACGASAKAGAQKPQ
jgi:hypothetical protein